MPDEDLLIIARITLMWGQIDTQLDHLIMHVYQLTDDQFNMVFGNKTIGPKNEFLAAGAGKRVPRQQEAIKEMTAAVSACLAGRNLMTHGLWGLDYNAKKDEFRSCAWSRNKRTRIFLDELPQLHEQVVMASEKADIAFTLIVVEEEPFDRRNRVMTFSSSDPNERKSAPPTFPR